MALNVFITAKSCLPLLFSKAVVADACAAGQQPFQRIIVAGKWYGWRPSQPTARHFDYAAFRGNLVLYETFNGCE
jgi:hypothetical protein